MIKIENFEVVGWEHAIRGMRNPMNSWEKSDSIPKILDDTDCTDECYLGNHNRCAECHLTSMAGCILGEKDHELMMKLAVGGPVHAKYRRMITVYLDITAPLYWWKEFDTYKVGTVANSCSTMHKIHEKVFTLEDFSCEHLMEWEEAKDAECLVGDEIGCGDCLFSPYGVINAVMIPLLNTCREKFLKAKENGADGHTLKRYWWQMIQLLPSSYNQKRTIMLNYEVLTGIYESRKNHKLDEWREFCKWIEQLPYSEIIIGTINPSEKVSGVREED